MNLFNDFVNWLRDEQLLNDDEIALVLYCITEEDGEDLYDALSERGYDEADSDTMLEAFDALYADYQVESYGNGNLKCGSKTYWIFDDYDEAKEMAIRYVQDLIADIGFTEINGWENFVDTEWFADAMRESYESYAYDIDSESDSTYGTRLVEECYDNGLIDDDDFEVDEDGEIDYTECTIGVDELVGRLTDYLCDQWGDPVEWYVDNFGDATEAAMNNNLVDVDALAEYVVDADGIANSLADYDSYENEYEFEGITYYIYRES